MALVANLLGRRSMILGLDFEDSLEDWKGAKGNYESSVSTLKKTSCKGVRLLDGTNLRPPVSPRRPLLS